MHIKIELRTLESIVENRNSAEIIMISLYDEKYNEWSLINTEIVALSIYDKPILLYIADALNSWSNKYKIKISHESSFKDCECCGSYYEEEYSIQILDEKFHSWHSDHFGNSELWSLDETAAVFADKGWKLEYMQDENFYI